MWFFPQRLYGVMVTVNSKPRYLTNLKRSLGLHKTLGNLTTFTLFQEQKTQKIYVFMDFEDIHAWHRFHIFDEKTKTNARELGGTHFGYTGVWSRFKDGDKDDHHIAS